jgi:hypothetical protein
LRDRFGNWVTFDFRYSMGEVPGAPQWNAWYYITDSVGRTHYVKFQKMGSDANPHVYEVELAGFNGIRNSFLFTQYRHYIPRAGESCGDNDPVTGDINVVSLSTIVFPDTSQYTMPSYSTTGSNCSAGLITQLGLPTGGSVKWDYGNYVFTDPGDSRAHRYRKPGVARRALVDPSGTERGAWIYNTQLLLAGGSPCCFPRELLN